MNRRCFLRRSYCSSGSALQQVSRHRPPLPPPSNSSINLGFGLRRLRSQDHRLPPPRPSRQPLGNHLEPSSFSPSSDAPIQDAHHDDASSTYHEIIRRYTGSRDPFDAERLHLELLKKGFAGDLFLSNNLVNLYAKAGDLASAREVFDQMPERNVVSWTCLITGHMQHGLPGEACLLFRSLIANGVEPTQFTYGSVLRACQDSGHERLSLVVQTHGRIMKTCYAMDTVVCNALISAYGGCSLGSSHDAQRVFDYTPAKNPISWNSIISVHSVRGNAESAFELFSLMQMVESGFKPSEYTYGSLVTATYSLSCAGCLLEQMLANVLKTGLSNDLYVGSAFVSAFARFGMPEKAKQIFLHMDERNAVSMNGLMVGLIKQNLGKEAMEVFREARHSVSINPDSYVVLLSALAEFSDSEEGKSRGREVHAHVILNNLIDSKVAIGNGLVNMYAKCGAVSDACRVFMHLNAKDQVSWNTLISGLDQNGLFEDAVGSFIMMLRDGVMPSNFTMISTLSSCASSKSLSSGRQVHCHGVKLGLDTDISVSNSLLAMYGECNNLSECWKLFRWMPIYDQISWNSMIGALAINETPPSESVGVLMDMMRSGWHPNRVTMINVLSALVPTSVSEMSRQIHCQVMKHGMYKDIVVENALLSCYAKCGEMNSCEIIFTKMAERRNDVSWNSMISGYIQNGLLQKAMDSVWLMMQSGQKLDCFTFATILSACASLAALERGMEIHAFGIRSNLEPDVVVGSALVDMYSKCGRIDYALRVFRSMRLKNEFSWNSMISGYARHGLGGEALELFAEMKAADQHPDIVTFVGVLSACSHAGLVDKGLKYFDCMMQYGLVPREEHYSCVVDLLGRAGRLDEMENFIKKMPMRPNSLIWRTVLVACRKSKDQAERDIWKEASNMLLELEPQNPVNYVLISNLYASKGRWEDVAKARTLMNKAPIKKEAGCSWVTFQDGVHVFVAGDRSHPSTEQIYAKLHSLIQKMKDAGYVPQSEFALYDLEAENKEELLSYHSEKLAVAFVLTRSSGVPIRIMKNIRVCGDCHSAFCYISKIVGRKIILRDSNRFHHFEDGSCSCGDYW